jgi:hypothetical protein
MKVCSKCKKSKHIVNFSKCISNKDRLQKKCKACVNEDGKLRWKNNKEKIKNINKEWKNNNPNYNNEYYVNNKEIFKKNGKEYYVNNKEKIIIKVKEYQSNIKNDPLKNEYKKIKQNTYQKKYRIKNPHYHILRNQIKNIKEKLNTPKNNSSIKELGYSPLQFKIKIESKFKEGMTWSNIGNEENKWNIDHKIPITWFKYHTPFSVVNNLENLQPMWRVDNIEKSNKKSDTISLDYYNMCINHIIKDKIKLVKYDT